MANIFIYMDESGCLGFKNPRASKYFVITLLKLDGLETQKSFFTAVRRTIKNKTSRTQRKTNFELKGSKTDLKIKKYFLKHLPSTGWSLYSVVLKKEKKHPNNLTSEEKERLYNFLTRYLLEHVISKQDISHLDLYMDKCKNKKEITEFNAYIKSNLNLSSSTFLNINHVTSHSNPAIQAVDLFCWGIARKYLLGEIDWYNCFNKHIKLETVYPPE